MNTEAERPTRESQVAAASQDLLLGTISLGKAAGELIFSVCTIVVLVFVTMVGVGYWFVAMADTVPVLPGGEKLAELPLLTQLQLYNSLGWSGSLGLFVGVQQCIVHIIGTILSAIVESLLQFRMLLADFVVPKVHEAMLLEIMHAVCKHGNMSKIATATADAVPAPV